MGFKHIKIQEGWALAFHSPTIHNLFILQQCSQSNVCDVQVLGRSYDFIEPRVEGEGSNEPFGSEKMAMTGWDDPGWKWMHQEREWWRQTCGEWDSLREGNGVVCDEGVRLCTMIGCMDDLATLTVNAVPALVVIVTGNSGVTLCWPIPQPSPLPLPSTWVGVVLGYRYRFYRGQRGQNLLRVDKRVDI